MFRPKNPLPLRVHAIHPLDTLEPWGARSSENLSKLWADAASAGQSSPTTGCQYLAKQKPITPNHLSPLGLKAARGEKAYPWNLRARAVWRRTPSSSRGMKPLCAPNKKPCLVPPLPKISPSQGAQPAIPRAQPSPSPAGCVYRRCTEKGQDILGFWRTGRSPSSGTLEDRYFSVSEWKRCLIRMWVRGWRQRCLGGFASPAPSRLSSMARRTELSSIARC